MNRRGLVKKRLRRGRGLVTGRSGIEFPVMS